MSLSDMCAVCASAFLKRLSLSRETTMLCFDFSGRGSAMFRSISIYAANDSLDRTSSWNSISCLRFEKYAASNSSSRVSKIATQRMMCPAKSSDCSNSTKRSWVRDILEPNIMPPGAYLGTPKLNDEISGACRFDRNSEKLRKAPWYFSLACMRCMKFECS